MSCSKVMGHKSVLPQKRGTQPMICTLPCLILLLLTLFLEEQVIALKAGCVI